jgi:hypothetical protein
MCDKELADERRRFVSGFRAANLWFKWCMETRFIDPTKQLAGSGTLLSVGCQGFTEPVLSSLLYKTAAE